MSLDLMVVQRRPEQKATGLELMYNDMAFAGMTIVGNDMAAAIIFNKKNDTISGPR